MSEISTFLGITVYMYFDGYKKPRFQVLYNGRHGIFSISTLGYSKGNLPPKVVGLVIDWADLHKKELLANWESVKDTGTCQRIKPLVVAG